MGIAAIALRGRRRAARHPRRHARGVPGRLGDRRRRAAPAQPRRHRRRPTPADILPGPASCSASGCRSSASRTRSPPIAEVPHEDAGAASGIVTAAFQVGGAIGLALVSTAATSRVTDAVAAGVAQPEALAAGLRARPARRRRARGRQPRRRRRPGAADQARRRARGRGHRRVALEGVSAPDLTSRRGILNPDAAERHFRLTRYPPSDGPRAPDRPPLGGRVGPARALHAGDRHPPERQPRALSGRRRASTASSPAASGRSSSAAARSWPRSSGRAASTRCTRCPRTR